jgi:hypothetical protein
MFQLMVQWAHWKHLYLWYLVLLSLHQCYQGGCRHIGEWHIEELSYSLLFIHTSRRPWPFISMLKSPLRVDILPSKFVWAHFVGPTLKLEQRWVMLMCWSEKGLITELRAPNHHSCSVGSNLMVLTTYKKWFTNWPFREQWPYRTTVRGNK